MMEPLPWKPKGMHWATYERLRLQAAIAKSRSWAPSLLKYLGISGLDLNQKARRRR